MASEGTHIFCTSCGKKWELCENGELRATEGETEFSHVPDWYLWEREQVKAEIERGEYSFEARPRIESVSPALADGFFTREPKGSSKSVFL